MGTGLITFLVYFKHEIVLILERHVEEALKRV